MNVLLLWLHKHPFPGVWGSRGPAGNTTGSVLGSHSSLESGHHIPLVCTFFQGCFPHQKERCHSPIKHGWMVSLNRQDSLKLRGKKKKSVDGNERDEQRWWKRCSWALDCNTTLRSEVHPFRFLKCQSASFCMMSTCVASLQRSHSGRQAQGGPHLGLKEQRTSSFYRKASFLSGASPMNNESSSFLCRRLLRAWFGIRQYRCKQITLGKEACTVSCLRGLWNPRLDDGGAWSGQHDKGWPPGFTPQPLSHCISRHPRPPFPAPPPPAPPTAHRRLLPQLATTFMAWFFFFCKVLREEMFGSLS